MSRKTIREGLYRFFGGDTPNVPVAKIFQAEPKEFQEQEFPAMFFFIPHGREERFAAQTKQIVYVVDIIVVHYGVAPDSTLNEKEFDDIIDTIMAKIRSDKTMNGVVTKWGEQMEHEVEISRDDSQIVLTGRIRVETVEHLQGV